MNTSSLQHRCDGLKAELCWIDMCVTLTLVGRACAVLLQTTAKVDCDVCVCVGGNYKIPHFFRKRPQQGFLRSFVALFLLRWPMRVAFVQRLDWDHFAMHIEKATRWPMSKQQVLVWKGLCVVICVGSLWNTPTRESNHQHDTSITGVMLWKQIHVELTLSATCVVLPQSTAKTGLCGCHLVRNAIWIHYTWRHWSLCQIPLYHRWLSTETSTHTVSPLPLSQIRTASTNLRISWADGRSASLLIISVISTSCTG